MDLGAGCLRSEGILRIPASGEVSADSPKSSQRDGGKRLGKILHILVTPAAVGGCDDSEKLVFYRAQDLPVADLIPQI